jgi:ribonuclease BN (tRNA processing enzyme)
MQLNILGCAPILQKNLFQNCSGYLIDNRLLFDCGPGIWHALNKSRIDAANLHHIIISHFHVDHFADIAPFLMARYLMLDNIKQPLSLTGPEGIAEWYKNVKNYCGSWAERIPVEVKEAKHGQEISGYQLRSALTGHSDNSLCFRLEDSAGNTFFYSGDTDENDAVRILAGKCDLALMESSNTEKSKIEGHLTPGRAAILAEEAGVKTLLLTHMYPDVSHEYALSEAKKYFSGDIIIARDGLIVNIDAS